jgi:ligand-binding sensor domain-containing protein
VQDARGFIWFGTQDGLDRFDGYAFVSYKHDPADPRSLASSWSTALLEDRAGRLWVGTRGGLQQRSRDGRGFERVSLGAPGDGPPQAPSISALAEGRDGSLWVGSDQGLFRIDTARDRVSVFRHDPGNRSSLAANQVRNIREDPDGTPWILTEDAQFRCTLNRFDGAFERIEISRTSAMTSGAGGALWLDPRRATSVAELRAHGAALSGTMPTTALTEGLER